MLNIRNKEKFLSTIPDWSIFNGVFKRKNARIGDMDGFIEINSHLLIIEVKSTGAEIPLGQKIAFENLSRKGKASILVLWGEKDVYTKYRVYKEGTTKPYEKEECTTEDIKIILRAFELWADRN